MKQIRIKFNGVDLLPYIIGFLILTCIFFNEFYGIIFFGYLVPIIMILTAINYIKKIKNPENVNLSLISSTEDIRIPSFSYKGFVNQGDNFSFVKMYFNESEIYLYFRNFFPIRIYQGPFILKKSYEFDDSFYVTEFKKINKSEIRFTIVNKTKSSSYKILLRNFTTSDYNLIIKNFKKLGWELSE